MREAQKISTAAEPAANKREQEISLILQLLENRIDEFKHDVFVSKELLPDGIKTGLVNNIEKTIENPFSQLLTLRQKLDIDLKDFSQRAIKILFKKRGSFIKEVYRCASFDNEALYCIVLKEDTFKNREAIFDILDVYDSILSNDLYPINFQFIPANLSSEINYIEKISVEA